MNTTQTVPREPVEPRAPSTSYGRADSRRKDDMAALKTSLVPSPLTRGVIDGTCKPRGGIELDIQDNNQKSVSQVIEENSKAMVAGELDVAEMSFGTYMRARDIGAPIRALPVFPGRRFLQ